MSVAWALVVSIWFEGKLVFAPPLTFATHAACVEAGEQLTASLARDHVKAPAVRFECVDNVAAPPPPIR